MYLVHILKIGAAASRIVQITDATLDVHSLSLPLVYITHMSLGKFISIYCLPCQQYIYNNRREKKKRKIQYSFSASVELNFKDWATKWTNDTQCIELTYFDDKFSRV